MDSSVASLLATGAISLSAAVISKAMTENWTTQKVIDCAHYSKKQGETSFDTFDTIFSKCIQHQFKLDSLK